MKMRRERDARRVAKSVRTHEATMAAYGKATGWHSSEGVTGMSSRITPGEGHVRSTAEPSFEFNDKIYTQKKWFDESHWGSQGISKKKSFTPKKISKKKEDE
jgi:hypothetical protein